MDFDTSNLLLELFVLAILYASLHYLTRLLLRTKPAGNALPLPPGPRGYPVVGALPHRALAALAKQHGPIMHLTLGQRGVVVASTPDAARLLLKDHGASFLDRPTDRGREKGRGAAPPAGPRRPADRLPWRRKRGRRHGPQHQSSPEQPVHGGDGHVVEHDLAENPAILRRAQAEMDGVVGRESDIPQLPYLRAVCKETFRKHPSTPLNLPRISTQPCDVQGYHIPKGTRMIVNIWAIGRDPAVWPEPARFDLGRFMTEAGRKVEPMGSHFELIPFGARMGVTLVHAFDWEIDMAEEFGLALQKKVPVRAVARPRLAASAYDE